MLPLRRRHESTSTRTSKTKSNKPKLPIELWIQILHEAQYDDLLPRYRWLRRYSLVCRAWRPHAQELLFAHVSLRGSNHCQSFQRAILSARDPAHGEKLRTSVRTLSITMDHQDIYADVLRLCPNVRELHVCMYHASFRTESLTALGAALPRTVKALRVRTYHYTALFQLLTLFPHIEYLEVDCSTVPARMPDPLPLPPPRWRLRELRYANLHRGAHGFIEWALSGAGKGSRETLEALRVHCPSFNPSVLPSLGVSRLRSLTIPRVSTGDDLSVLTHIEEVWMIAPRNPGPTFIPLPSSVRHLALHPLEEGGDYAGVMSDLSAYYMRSGGNLEVLTYHRRYDEDDESVDDIRMLHDFCAENNVEFRLMDPPYGYYAGERVPFEPLTECPRLLSYSARRRMGPEKLAAIVRIPRRRPTFTQKIARTAKKAFENAIPAVGRP
ncbi:hypothetical protein PYCCODRAFT_261971 [Trametes coccinea BRFM310]|uniref:F-box domain-containing protein n=1 Tax=Trametes coccinea (strain BRFM310) TaxID=1353009 RepID=A0A1Y2IRM3_TRAC3|nr:hypothetical protein PYCCODRAFT_261971 [Trametes coccinea BRFM310]